MEVWELKIDDEPIIPRLIKAGVKFNTHAEQLFTHPAFSLGASGEVDIQVLDLYELGLKAPSTFAQITHVSSQRGLALCPLRYAAFLRLATLDQTAGPYLHVASLKPELAEDFPNGFYLRNHENSLWLRGYRASDDWAFPPESEFAFLR